MSMTEESEKLLGLKKCNCEKSNLKIIADGQKSIVMCTNCGKRTNSCNSEEHSIFCWNNGFFFKA